MRHFKFYLYLAGSLNFLIVIIHSAALATVSQSATISSKPGMTTNTLSEEANSNTATYELSVSTIIEATPVPSPLSAQTVTGTIAQAQNAQTFSVENQVTSVSQLADVQPTDWAFQALQSLIERYGVIAGYPDLTYRGDRAITRYEFAVGIKAALDRVEELIQAGLSERVSHDDLATLQQLQAEFGTEIATLRGRVDNLEAQAAEIEANQFSITTKLTGQLVAAVTGGGFTGERIIAPNGAVVADEDLNATIIYRASLDFNTNFTGTGLLKIRLTTGSDGPNDNVAGFLEPNLGSVLDFSVPGRDNKFGLGRLYYSFTPLQDLKITLGSAIVATEYVDRNSYANISFLNFSTQALINNFVLFPRPAGAGAAIDWSPVEKPFKFRAVYVAANAASSGSDSESERFIGGPRAPILLFPNSGGDRGLFGDPRQGIIELEYSPSKNFALRLQYSRGKVFESPFNIFGANFELALSQQIGIFGRYGYGSYDNTLQGDINPNYWMAGVAFRDLFAPGALAGVAAGQPFIEDAVGNATQTNFEAFYNFPLSDNIKITPLVQAITNSGNQDSNGTIITGTLRTVFSF